MKRNSGIIGPLTMPNTSTAAGVHDTYDVYNSSLNGAWPKAPIYNSFSASTTSLTETNTVNFTLSTTNVPDNTLLYWTLDTNATTITGADFSDGAISGSFIVSGGQAYLSRTLVIDANNSEIESFRIQVRERGTTGTVVINSPIITVGDASISISIFSTSSGTTTINEGQSVVFRITHNNVLAYTNMYWEVVSNTGTINSSDFSDSSGMAATYYLTTANGSLDVTKTLSNDVSTEGTESFYLRVRNGSSTGAILATTSSSITVSDTSTATPPPPPPPPPPPGSLAYYTVPTSTITGTITNTSMGLCNIYWMRSFLMWTISSSEIVTRTGKTSGTISRLRFYVSTSAPLYQPLPSYAIGMKLVTTDINTSPGNTGYTIVKSASSESFTANTYKEFIFTSSFSWNSSFNLAIQVAWGQCPTTYNNSGQNYYTSTGTLFGTRTDSAGTYSINGADGMSSQGNIRPIVELYI